MSEKANKPLSELEAELRSVNAEIDELIVELEPEAEDRGEEPAEEPAAEDEPNEGPTEDKEADEEPKSDEPAEARAASLIARKDELLKAIEEAKLEVEQRKAAAAEIIKGDVAAEFRAEEAKTMTNAEVRQSEAYVKAYAEYIRSGNDEECRSLLTENVEGGVVPVPAIVEGYIRTAWENEGIMALVDKSYIKGNVKVGFERSATDAAIHTEGAAAPAEETLLIGVVDLVAQSLKKWITVSDEALDLNGQEFIDYIYDEIAQKIAKLAADTLLAQIIASPAVSSATAPAVATLSGAVAAGTVIQAEALLSDEARNPVVVMNKQTYGAFKSLTTQDGYLIADPFDGLTVVFNNSLPAYSAADAGAAYAIVGDFGTGAKANFPNGDEIKFTFDEYSLAEQDLVKIVGRMFVGLGVVAPNRFTVITKPE